MNRIIILGIFLLLTTSAYAQNFKINYSFKSFEEAKKSKNFIRFDMESTKLGLITTSFTGFVKNFTIEGDRTPQSINNARVSFDVKDMDTDVDSRNEKMYKKCFSIDKFPKIFVTFKDSVVTMNVRGKEKPIVVDFQIDGNEVSGSLEVKLSKLEIPDPSIIVASVNDTVKISFNVLLK